MKFDVLTIIVAVVFSLLGILRILLYPQNLPETTYWSMRGFIIGFLLLIVMTVGNSLVESNWNLDYIINFLSVREVGRWFFRVSASLSYIVMIIGFVSFLIIKTKKRQ